MNLDLLADLADFESRIDYRICVDLKNDTRLNKRSESRKRCFELVRANGEIRQHITSRFIAEGAAADPRVGLRRGNFNARQHRSALISHSPTDLCRRLCPNRDTTQHANQQSLRNRKDSALHGILPTL